MATIEELDNQTKLLNKELQRITEGTDLPYRNLLLMRNQEIEDLLCKFPHSKDIYKKMLHLHNKYMAQTDRIIKTFKNKKSDDIKRGN